MSLRGTLPVQVHEMLVNDAEDELEEGHGDGMDDAT